MKANELRIGNWVDYQGQPHTLTSIHRGGNVSVRLNDGSFDSEKTGVTYLTPIPITEEWLERLGFNKHLENKFEVGVDMGYWVKNGVCLFFNKSDHNTFLTGYADMINGEYISVTFNWYTKHIHQLQNLYFALCGKELNQEQ